VNSNTKPHAHDVSVRSKFMRVHSLLKLCARTHAHSLEATLVSLHILACYLSHDYFNQLCSMKAK